MNEPLPGRERYGLRDADALALLAVHGPNELPSTRSNFWRQAWEVVSEPMLLLLIGAGAVNFLLAEPFDGFVLVGVVLVVLGISIYQTRKTETALTALHDLSSPRAQVIREGRQIRIAARDLVPGDLLMVAEGDRVAADAVVVEQVNLQADESTLTGESFSVTKSALSFEHSDTAMGTPGGDGTPWIFAGSLIVKGHGLAVVQRTGGKSELGKIGSALSEIDTGRTRFQREVDRLVRVIAALSVVAASAVAVIFGVTRGNWLEGLLAAIAAAMSLLPEEFPVILTVFMALGAWRMSKRNVLARRSPVIETLGSATVICVDKTGTLTLNQMTVREFITASNRHLLDEQPLPADFLELAEYAFLASPVDPFDPMDKAFRAVGENYLLGSSRLHPDWSLVHEYPLTESLMAMGHVWRASDRGHFEVAAKGAPEAIIRLCRFEGGSATEIADTVSAATAGGQRVLAVAKATLPFGTSLPSEIDEIHFEFVGLVGLHDPVRPGAAKAVADCAAAGVRTIMITGDYPGTAMAIGADIGLPLAGGVITGPELEALNDAELAARVGEVNVYARMVPSQKLRLVRALSARGEVVAMTGDGVNDAPALRAADIGIAMGARGTDVAREAAALVITDDDFGSIAEGVRLGRGIFANIRKAMSYVIAVHASIVGMALLPVFVDGWPLILLPVQIAFLELIIDPACSVVFEAEEIDPEIMTQAPRRVDEPIFTRRALVLAALQGVSGFVAVATVFGAAVWQGQPDQVIRSLAFATLVLGNLGLILVNRSARLSAFETLRQRRNGTIKWIFGFAALGLVAMVSITPVAAAFKLAPLSPVQWLAPLCAALIGVSWIEAYKLARRRVPGLG